LNIQSLTTRPFKTANGPCAVESGLVGDFAGSLVGVWVDGIGRGFAGAFARVVAVFAQAVVDREMAPRTLRRARIGWPDLARPVVGTPLTGLSFVRGQFRNLAQRSCTSSARRLRACGLVGRASAL